MEIRALIITHLSQIPFHILPYTSRLPKGFHLFFFFFFFTYLPSPNLGLTPPGTYKQNARGSNACRRSNNLWTRTLDRYTMCIVWSAQCPGLRRRQHRIEHKEYTPNLRTEIKIPDPAGNRTRAAGLEGRDSTDHVTVMDRLPSLCMNLWIVT